MNDFLERIVITLDAASESGNAIEIAARLAARAHLPLRGVFVEDEDLLSLANLPFARQVALGAGAGRLTLRHVEEELHLAAKRAKRDLATWADQHGLAWSFEIVRGSSQRLRFLTSEHDFVVAGALTRPVAGQFRVECRWWSSIGAAPGPLLLIRRGWEAGGEVLIILRDRSRGSVRLLGVAARIAEARNDGLTVICAADLAGEEGLETWISDHLSAHFMRFRIERVQGAEAVLHQRMRELDCGLLAVAPSWLEARPDWVRDLVERLACDLLVVP